MRAAQDWLEKTYWPRVQQRQLAAAPVGIAPTPPIKLNGWLVAGASKRGWTTWMVGAVTCPNCVKILGICPLVPIVPNLLKEVHRQWMSYGGFTFAFSDYTALNRTQRLGSPEWTAAMEVVDPAYYGQR